MTPDRLRQIEELYHSARNASPQERAALLERTDPELRREVESLLARENDRLILDSSPPFAGDLTVTVLSTGARLGPYQVESKLGEGGMGEVFRGIDTRLGRPVAIKIVQQRFNARFEREARAISSLNHPNICTLYDIGPNYLVMELLDGGTLADQLRNGPLPAGQALRYAAQIAGALGEAHERGIVHRDLKPGNIMVTKSGVKILDFGLATWDGDDTLTGSHMVMGTPAYMAPEQREGKLADARSDLYSFGCVMYEMWTGARATADRKPVPSKAVERIVSRCLETAPSRRWQSASEVTRALEATESPAIRIPRAAIAASCAALVATIAAAGYFHFRPTPKLTDKDIVVLADFVNKTGDPIFDGTLRQGLAIQLEQSPFLKIMDEEQVRRVLELMRLAPDAVITDRVAHDICVREGAAATIGGSIASLGKNYAITLQATGCHDGATLARELVQTPDKEHVLSGLGAAVTAVRGKLGESLSSIRKLNRPLEEATTGSLEALQNYTAGNAEMGQGHFLGAVPLLDRAIALDPNFAMAYSYLSIGYDNAGEAAKSRENGVKAFSLSSRVSEYERDIMTADYYEHTGEVDKAIDAYRSGIRNYPRDWALHNNLSTLLIELGRYEEGLAEGLEAARLGPNTEPPNRRLLDAYMCLDRLPDAKSLGDKLLARGSDGPRIHQRLLEIAYADGDQAAADRETQWFAGKPAEYLSFALQAAHRNVLGQRAESHKLYQRAAEAAKRLGFGSFASELEEADAQAAALAGNCQPVRGLGRPALALAMCGDGAQAEKAAAQASKYFPNGTVWNAVQHPAIQAALALHNQSTPARSLDLLASAAPYERGYLEATYLRGLAYLRLRKGAEAIAEFRKIVDHKSLNWGSAWRAPYWAQFYSLSYLGVARGYVLAGDKANAAAAFRSLFELWGQADTDLPVVQQAKAEHAALRQ